MPEVKELICVNCPKGCHISVTLEDSRVINVKGYSCPKGKKYAEVETVRPMRVLTTTIKVNHGTLRVLPVMTDSEIPLDQMKEAMEEIRKIQVDAPVEMNQILVKNFLGTDANLIASRSMKSL